MNSDNQKKNVKSCYSELIQQRDLSDLNDEVARGVGLELSRYGREAKEFITKRLKTADPTELRKLLAVIKYIDHRGMDEGLIDVVVNRVIPLDLKVDYFREMSLMGISLDSKFLQQLHEADELYLQLSSYFKSDSENALPRALELNEEFHILPATLKLSFLEELAEHLPGAMPFFLHILGQEEAIDLLIIDLFAALEPEDAARAMVESSEADIAKPVMKKIRKELYRLKEKGVTIPEKPEEVIIPEVAPSGETAYATTFDSFGARLLLLSTPTISGVMACQAACDDVKGLLRFSAVEMPRRQFREFLRDFKEQVRERGISTLIKIDSEHCRSQLQRAYEQNLASGTLVPENFKQIRYRIKPAEDYSARQELAALVSPDEKLVAAMEKDYEDAFSIKEVSIWMVEKENLLPYTSKYVDMVESKLVADDDQRRKMLEEALEEYTEEYFTNAQVERVIRRLLDTSYMLVKADRKQDAELLLALVHSIESLGEERVKHKFFSTFILRSIVGTIEALKTERIKNESL